MLKVDYDGWEKNGPNLQFVKENSVRKPVVSSPKLNLEIWLPIGFNKSWWEDKAPAKKDSISSFVMRPFNYPALPAANWTN